MSKPSESSESKPYIVTHTPSVLIVISLILLVIFGSLWWTRVYNSPRRVFEAMLRNNLSTISIIRTSTSPGQKGFERIERLSFGQPVASRTYIRLEEQSAQGITSVETETIGTQQNDYSKYLKIDVGGEAAKTEKYSRVLGSWGQSSIVDGEPQYLNQAMQGLVPFANLKPSDRDKIIDFIKTKEVYKVNYASTKLKKLNKKSAIEFSVNINPSKYLEMLQQISEITGVGDLSSLNPEDYSDQPDINISIIVDKLSRQVMEATYGQQKETYSGYGLNRSVTIPEKTIPFRELQQKVQAIE